MRVLQVVNDMRRAGLETMLMNYYRNIDRSKLQFDFLTHRPTQGEYDREIFALGGRVYHAPRLYPQNYPAYFRWMRRFWAGHPEYRVVHAHIDAMSYLPLLTAKEAGVPLRIAHSHNTAVAKDFKYPLKQYFRARLPAVANAYLACGEQAGRFLFGSKAFDVIPNAVDAASFRFSAAVREEKRRELGLKGALAVGHVGRFSYQKNHDFLLEIFAEVKKRRGDAVLLLIGEGEREQAVRAQAAKRKLDSSVRFLGSRGDMSELYQAMDVLVMPSRFEGVPLVGIEAQFAGLPCVFSDKTPREVRFCSRAEFLPLSALPQVWAEHILKSCTEERSAPPLDAHAARYDIQTAHTILEDYYLSQLEKVLSSGSSGVPREILR